MQEHNLKTHIESLFKNTKFSDENNNIFVNKIFEAIEKIDTDFVEILLADDKAKKHFFSKVLDTFVMNQFKLIDFFSMNNYFEESYTSYTNKIGLIRKDDFIKKNNDVVLAFPYKDCVLEGGQTKEDQKGKENFFNEILDSDEIDRLFEPKVLTNIKRYSKDGMEENPTISEKDNLILKGNNLLTLHSLKKKYAGKVKLIYIDPPYNTGSDSFKYNDSFNHSTWLTFMKNRLEVAREFLRDDGAIFVSCDDNEQAYLKVLMDDIFKQENFIGNFVWKKRQASGKQVADNYFSLEHEYITVYCQDNSNFRFIGVDRDRTSYTNPDNDPRGDWAKHPLDVGSTKEERPNCFYAITDPKTGIKYQANEKRVWAFNPESMAKLIEEEKIIFHPTGKTKPYHKKFWTSLQSATKPISSWISYGEKPIESDEVVNLVSLYNTEGTKLINKLFEFKAFDTAKPLSLLKSLIKALSKDNDVVLDFFSGSGTTGHAVLELNKEDDGNRKFIMVEQMDYIETITVPRIVKVMERDYIDDSFVYAELKQVSNFDNGDKKLKQEMRYLPIGELEDKDYKISKEEISINKAFYGVEDE